ncbi:MAG: CDP-alcohol phosphatidyltransferase family protein [Vicinamibacterales bacterium]
MTPPASGVNWAHVVTGVRLGLALWLWRLGPSGGWALVGVATVGALLDLVDGPIARRSGRTSAFGARFDMETDAFLILTLSVLVWRSGHAGGWVLASGLMRYVFVAAAAPLPWLAADLPPSVRRQAVCVVQIVALVVALAPIVTPPLSTAISAAGLAVLACGRLAGRRLAGSPPHVVTGSVTVIGL